MKTLVIVESGTKAREIQHIINKMGYKDWIVKASSGHIKCLPVKSMGVNIDSTNKKISIDLVFIDSKKNQLVKTFRQISKGANVILATDPDREGEAIAYHLFRELQNSAKQITRAKFHAITPEGIKKGLASQENIDINLVLAQTARSVLDRLWGYRLSFPLADALGDRNASVGRVQSATLKMVYDREMEIRNFKPIPYWIINFITEDGAKFVSPNFKNKDDAEKFLEEIRQNGLSVKDLQIKKSAVAAPKPLKASTLQQLGNKKLGMSSSETMKVAQQLFQSHGLISYMRTDSVRSDPETIRDAFSLMDHIAPQAKPSTPNNHRNGKGATQDAHECIHPTHFDLEHSPQKIGQKLSPKELDLYTLIWNRYMASQSKPALWENTKIIATTKKTPINMTCSGKRLLDPGWTTFEPTDDKLLPHMSIGQTLNGKPDMESKKTEPKSRYNNASLIKSMETNGIGRPSTYATVNETLLKRGFITEKGKSYWLTPKGEKAILFESEICPQLIDITYTAQMEDMLDDIAEKKADWKNIVLETHKDSTLAEQRANTHKNNPKFKLAPNEIVPGKQKSRIRKKKKYNTKKTTTNYYRSI